MEEYDYDPDLSNSEIVLDEICSVFEWTTNHPGSSYDSSGNKLQAVY